MMYTEVNNSTQIGGNTMKITTTNDVLHFETKEEIINYFNDAIQADKDNYFYEYEIVVENETKVNSYDDWMDFLAK